MKKLLRMFWAGLKMNGQQLYNQQKENSLIISKK